MEIVLSSLPGKESCDFCSSPNVTESYSCGSFTWIEEKGISLSSLGDWAACEECAKLVDTDEWDGLLGRMVESFTLRNPEVVSTRVNVREDMNDLLTKFRGNRT